MRLGAADARPGVYLITNTVNSKRYVGSSVNCRKRVRYHATGYGSAVLRAAIAIYGEAAFCAEVVEFCERPVLPQAEARWIKRLRPGYNIQPLTDSGGHLVADVTREKIRKKATGRRHAEAAKQKLRDDWAKSDHAERRARMRTAALGRKMSASGLAAKSAALKGIPWSPARHAAENARKNPELGFIEKEYRL